jgi:Transposase DDE domain
VKRSLFGFSQDTETMKHQLLPVAEVKVFFPGIRKDYLKGMFLLIACFICERTVSLYKCRAAVGKILGKKGLNLASQYKRFIRLFKTEHVDQLCVGIAWLIVHLCKLDGSVYLVMDRTNWKIGDYNINVLFLGLLLPSGVFIPVLWEPLAKKGNSSTEERQALMKRFETVWKPLGKNPITVLADREFIGQSWFISLRKLGMGLVIRARWQDYMLLVAQTLEKTILETENYIKKQVRRKGKFQAEIKMGDYVFYYTVFENTGARKGNDKWVVLISDIKDMDLISQTYRKRWGIEVFFLHCKSNGFNLEDLNLKEEGKVQLMMGLVAVAYCLSIEEGLRLEQEKPRAVKNKATKGTDNDRSFNAISIFRQGLDNLKSNLHCMDDLWVLIIQGIRRAKKRGMSQAVPRGPIKSVQ